MNSQENRINGNNKDIIYYLRHKWLK